MKNMLKLIFIVIFMLFFDNRLYSYNNIMMNCYFSEALYKERRILHDSCQTIFIYSVNNITNEVIAKIEVKIVIRNKKILYAKANIIENGLDGINCLKKIVLSVENNFIILQVQLNNGLPINNKPKWVGEVSASIFLGITKKGYIKSFTTNSTIDESNLRFGGDFLYESKGIFRTKADIL